MTQHVLVTGGAGYIGAHACKALKQAGYTPVCFDNLSTGWKQAVKFGPLEEGDLGDRARLDAVFAKYKPIAVMHFAALSLVGESMSNPSKYWSQNVMNALNLIEAAIAANCMNFVFSSTCATYGDQDGVILNEDTPQRPINAYGGSKRAIEDMLRDFGMSHGLNSVIFRYFNVAGADPEGEVGEQHVPETHLIPLMLDAIDGKRAALTVFGSDYATPDGTCVRDYVHVSDLVDAHVLGLKWLEDAKGNAVFCLGSGKGFSVREVIAASRSVTNRDVPIVEGERRAGDAASLVSGSRRALSELGWAPKRSELSTMIADAWRWHQAPEYEY
ncbi:UDP-glucose 4-epimerase GalE [Thioclava sp. BHET1]|uniref:UDP-glucose 4-epimerase n=1 Tax=Thioclava dalianensis TaxID=1185766 RepID=A0A074TI44_9RHOB|nr:UDP-glucose 4-epimerase GalE [Thioclava dalianensis]KEP68693.1 UDP-glucose 4-epimerase [Thioclava dalianensis]TMV94211.1 UDP-glucose 4-epimerase GalE [Thioclava sp. BHET1]SFM95193.1 UDP-glucose 4-epimerase [Thioclava dalianensis]